jgi:hypothetical protein
MIRTLLARYVFSERYLRAFFAARHDIARQALEDSGKWFVAHKTEPPIGQTFFGVIYAARTVNVVIENPGSEPRDTYAMPGDCMTLLGGAGADQYRWVVRLQAERLQ